MKLNIKHSFLKWLSHLYKGTTYGYATRKDCLVVFGFLLLLYFLPSLYFAYHRIFYYISSVIHILTIIATFSLIFMRINDIFGKHYMKGRVPEFFVIYFLVGIGGKIIFDIEPKDSIGWFQCLLWFILCICPPAEEREDMPEIEYKLPKLPKKAITAFAIALAITMVTIIVILAMTYYDGYK